MRLRGFHIICGAKKCSADNYRQFLSVRGRSVKTNSDAAFIVALHKEIIDKHTQVKTFLFAKASGIHKRLNELDLCMNVGDIALNQNIRK